jgi:hypothetical protein
VTSPPSRESKSLRTAIEAISYHQVLVAKIEWQY